MLKFINNLNKSSRFINIHNQKCNGNNYNIKINNTNLFNKNNSSFSSIIKYKFTTAVASTSTPTTTNIQTSPQNSFNKYESSNDNNEGIEERGNDLERRKELIRLVSENPNCSHTIMNLCFDMDNQEMIPNPFYTVENRGDRASFPEFSQLDFATLALSIDKNMEALDFICNYLLMEGYHGIYLFDKNLYNGKYISFRMAAELYYKACDGNTSNSISNFIISLNESQTYKMIDGTIISVVGLILEGIKKHSDSLFHGMLSSFMSKNHYIKLPTNDGNYKEMDRMELLKFSIESHKDNLIYSAYIFNEIGLLLENKKDTIKLFGDQTFTKQTAFAKGIELSNGYFEIQLLIANELVKYMSVNDRVSINNVQLSRIDLLKSFENIEHEPKEKQFLIESFKQLSKFYKLDGNIQESNRFHKLAEIETQNFKSYLIKSIEDTVETTVKCCDFNKFCHLLASEILKDGETVTFSYEPSKKMDRFDLASYAAHYDGQVKNYNCTYSKLMLESMSYLPTKDCNTALIKEFNVSPSNPKAYHVLAGIVKIKDNYHVSPNSPGSYLQLMNILYKNEIDGKDHFENDEQIPNKSIILSKIYSRLIALEPEVPENYLQLGIHLKESLVDSISIEYPICPTTDKHFIIKNNDLSYTRKELFSKYLELKFNTDSINGILNSEAPAWYLLSMEMNNDNEILFGKSRKQILTNIIENIDPSFSQAYLRLSDLIEIDDDSEKIQLLLKAIQFESDLNIKSIHLNKLANTLIDNDQKVELIGDGRKLNKQQLLIESIEIYPRKNHSSSLRLLVNTLENSNDNVSLFGQNFNKTELLEILLVHLELDGSNQNYLETFKIKSNIILNKFNDYF